MNFIPELNYWIYNRYFESPVNEYHFNFPVELSQENWSVDDSVLNLLFNESFTASSYRYMFNNISFQSITCSSLRMRLSAYRGNLNIYVIPDISIITNLTNALELTIEELELCDILLNYRISTTNDSSSIVVVTDELDSLDYNNLTSSFSKLIYIYLQVMINDDMTLYDNTTPIANTNRLIELIYEKFILDSCFRKNEAEYITLDSSSDCKVIDLENTTEYISVDSSSIIVAAYPLSDNPFFLEDMIVILNGVKKQVAVDFTVTIVNDVSYLNWNGLGLQDELQADDKLFVSYSHETSWEYTHTPIEVT
jgi:hypothetical protein